MPQKALFVILMLNLLEIGVSQAADFERGKQLHNQNCMSCHQDIMSGNGDAIYIRPNRRIDNYDALVKQVGRCKDNLGVPWPEEEVMDVVEYLNTRYYQFKQ
ncbi:MAG: cytochrome c [Gammaproteobacteria bacterium]|nr:cytochrome c [Gammaproteobacteria bacterium]